LQTEKVVNALKTHDTQSPLFLYVPYLATHDPLEAPQSEINKFKHIPNHKRQIKAAMISLMDQSIGVIVQNLKDLGYWNNTILVFSADNGGQTANLGLNWPYRGGKFTQWEGGTKVVGFVNSPLLKNAPNTKRTHFMHSSDWYPTFLRIASNASYVQDPKFSWLDGFDQWDSITKGVSSKRSEILYNIDPLNVVNGYMQAALRVGDWKILTGNPCGESSQAGQFGDCGWTNIPGHPSIASPKLAYKPMLFNLTADPFEQNDLASKKPEVLAQMLAKIEEYKKGMVKPLYQTADPHCNPGNTGGAWVPWVK
jgi:arylsulfatase A-like enzyme